mmetsp:Transcript_33207/g.98701  ORF Transcript_33207/g.98701 Transcript_33207/m.98701 type:complete len:601 (-) Transcript_33207:93-1895(-)
MKSRPGEVRPSPGSQRRLHDEIGIRGDREEIGREPPVRDRDGRPDRASNLLTEKVVSAKLDHHEHLLSLSLLLPVSVRRTIVAVVVFALVSTVQAAAGVGGIVKEESDHPRSIDRPPRRRPVGAHLVPVEGRIGKVVQAQPFAEGEGPESARGRALLPPGITGGPFFGAIRIARRFLPLGGFVALVPLAATPSIFGGGGRGRGQIFRLGAPERPLEQPQRVVWRGGARPMLPPRNAVPAPSHVGVRETYPVPALLAPPLLLVRLGAVASPIVSFSVLLLLLPLEQRPSLVVEPPLPRLDSAGEPPQREEVVIGALSGRTLGLHHALGGHRRIGEDTNVEGIISSSRCFVGHRQFRVGQTDELGQLPPSTTLRLLPQPDLPRLGGGLGIVVALRPPDDLSVLLVFVRSGRGGSVVAQHHDVPRGSDAAFLRQRPPPQSRHSALGRRSDETHRRLALVRHPGVRPLLSILVGRGVARRQRRPERVPDQGPRLLGLGGDLSFFGGAVGGLLLLRSVLLRPRVGVGSDVVPDEKRRRPPLQTDGVVLGTVAGADVTEEGVPGGEGRSAECAPVRARRRGFGLGGDIVRDGSAPQGRRIFHVYRR